MLLYVCICKVGQFKSGQFKSDLNRDFLNRDLNHIIF